jgi:twitching motility protein PilJ
MTSTPTSLNLKRKMAAAAAFLFLLWAVLAAYSRYQDQQQFDSYARQIDKLPVLSQQLAKNAQLAASGSDAAYAALADNRSEFTGIIGKLDSSDGSPPADSADIRVALNEVIKSTNSMLQYVRVLEDGHGAAANLTSAVSTLGADLTELKAVVQDLTRTGTPAQKSPLTELAASIAKIDDPASAVMRQEPNPDALSRLAADIKAVQAYAAALPANSSTAAHANELLETCRKNVELVRTSQEKQLAARKAAASIAGDSETLLAASQRLVDVYRISNQIGPTYIGILVPAVLLIISLLMVTKYYIDEMRSRTEALMRINRQNEEGILRLTEELNALADGDLTMHATVGESLTGPIADSVNHTAEVFRKLVIQINNTSEQMENSLHGGKDISHTLMKSARKQTREIQKIGDAVEMLHSSIKSIAALGEQNGDRARSTLAESRQGTVAVAKLGSEMRVIDGQIAHSTKLLAKLGESTQQIADQIELISDIAEQTSVLALNAAIQAASSGGAGRGFAIVAEEVQRLAARSGELVKHVARLARSVQNDANEVVADLEKSRAAIERSDQVADTTRKLLQDLAKTAKELDETSMSIVVTSKVQSGKVREMANAMQGVFDITLQNADSSRLTDGSIAEINRLAEDLRGSVASFKI